MGKLDQAAKTQAVQRTLEKYFHSKTWEIEPFDLSKQEITSSPQWLGFACEILFYFNLIFHVPRKEESPLEVIRYAYGFKDQEIKKSIKSEDVLIHKAWEHAAWRIRHRKDGEEDPPLEESTRKYLRDKNLWFKKITQGVTKCDPKYYKLGGDAIILKNGKWEVIEIKNDSSSMRKNSWVNQALLLYLKKYYEEIGSVDYSVLWVPCSTPGVGSLRRPLPAENRAEKLFARCISEDAKVSIVCPRAERVYSFYPIKNLKKIAARSPYLNVLKAVSKYFY